MSRSDLAEVLQAQAEGAPATHHEQDVVDQLRKSAGNSLALQEAARADLAAMWGNA